MLGMKMVPSHGWRPKTSLRKTCIQKCEIPQNCPFPLPFLTVIAFHRVKKSPLITGIVDRIKINSEQPFPFSESDLSNPYLDVTKTLKRGTGNGERGTEVWERVVSGNLHKNPKWRDDGRKMAERHWK